MWIHRHALRVGCTTAALLLSFACSEVTGDDHEWPETLPEDRGVAITPLDAVGYWSELVWSADDREIYYIAMPPSGPFSVKAAAVESGAQRELDATDRQYQSLQLSPDGTLLYYLASGDMYGGAYAVYVLDVAGGGPTMLVDSVDSFVVSQDGAHLAFSRTGSNCSGVDCDSVRVLTLATGYEEPVTVGEPLTFSSDGNALVCARWNPETITDSYYVTRIADGATHELDIGESEGRIRSIRWDGQGLKVLQETVSCFAMECHEQFFVRQPETADVRMIWEYTGRDWGGPGLKAWSHDGGQFVFVTWHCAETEELFSCAVPQFKLRVVDPARESEQITAVVNAAVGSTAFARARRSIAYAADAQIYVTDY